MIKGLLVAAVIIGVLMFTHVIDVRVNPQGLASLQALPGTVIGLINKTPAGSAMMAKLPIPTPSPSPTPAVKGAQDAKPAETPAPSAAPAKTAIPLQF